MSAWEPEPPAGGEPPAADRPAGDPVPPAPEPAAGDPPPPAAEPAAGDPPPPAGLCDRCRHQQVVRNTRGSAFSLCLRSRDDPDRFPRYPRLPVISCPGFARMIH